MRIHLGGHLDWYDARRRAWIERPQEAPIALIELARELGLPIGEIGLVAVNKRIAVLGQDSVSDGDVVEFFSPLGGG